MVCITLFPATNCILSVSCSRKEKIEALEFLRLSERELCKLCAMLFRVSQLYLGRYNKRRFNTIFGNKLTSSHCYNTKCSCKNNVSIFFIIGWKFTLDV